MSTVGVTAAVLGLAVAGIPSTGVGEIPQAGQGELREVCIVRALWLGTAGLVVERWNADE